MRRCVILAAGPVEEPALLLPLLREDDWIVAADGGVRLAEKLGVRPDLIVADFDSGSREEAECLGVRLHILPQEKDTTDTQEAAAEAFELGYRSFLLLGCTGGRLDHMMGALCVMQWIARRGGHAVLADEHNRLMLVGPGEWEIAPHPGWKLSLLAYGGPVSGVTLRQVRYPLTEATLTTDNPIGVSNEFEEKPAKIRFRSGFLQIFLSRD